METEKPLKMEFLLKFLKITKILLNAKFFPSDMKKHHQNQAKLFLPFPL
jgi:hypothetical protein